LTILKTLIGAVFVLLFVHLVVLRIIKRFVKIPAPPIVGLFLDSRLRKWLQPPLQVIERAEISAGMTVLDLGCGNGAMTTEIARAVGSEGTVCGVDIQREMLAGLRRKLSAPENASLKNILLVRADACALPFADGTFDRAVMVTVLGEVRDDRRVLREARRVLKSGGVLAVTELLPDPDYYRSSTVVRLGKEAGFESADTVGNFFNYTVRLRGGNNGSHRPAAISLPQ